MPYKINLLSIVIPLFNEEKRIIKTVPKIETFLEKFTKSTGTEVELVFVNDGSTDKTVNILKKIIKHNNFKLVSYKQNSGKGFALKQGFMGAKGEYIMFMDADLSTPLKHLYIFIKNVNQETSVLIGSRKVRGAKVTKHQSFIRENLGKGYTLLSNIFTVWGISDFTCGFKLFEKDIGKKIFKNVTINRWGFDSEILFLAKRFNCKIIEIPVSWKNDNDTKVDLKKDVIRSLIDIFKIRKNAFLQVYDKA